MMLLKQRIVGIDRERDLAALCLCTRLAQRARGRERHIARAGRKEHEADHVGARLERGIERLGGRKPADFDQK